MKREVTVFLVLGSCVIFLLEFRAAVTSVTRALHGPYPAAQRSQTATIPALRAMISPGILFHPASSEPRVPQANGKSLATSSSNDPSYLPSLAEN